MYRDIIGKTVTITIDRPLGSVHPKHKDIVYTVNYGFVEVILGGDGEEQDAYVLGVNEPLSAFTGMVIA
ncbi:MAG: inorganic pyrophosphatase, partial [Eubacterium sp.]|nr:inorganic pyrophosphatase [Eubacterium sp.]